MNKIKSILLVAVTILSALPLAAQPKQVSPRETTNSVIDGNSVTIAYGRPYTKDPKSGAPRKIWGGLVPYGKVWRTGANEATKLTLEKPIQIGETTIPAGSYSLFTLPNEDGTAKLIINKQTGQWGVQHDSKQDLARVDLKKEAMEPSVDQFTMAVVKNPAGGGLIKLMWENTQYSVAFVVPK